MDPRIPRPRTFPGDRQATKARVEAPEIPLAIVEWLERLCPEVLADPDDVPGPLMYIHGRRSVAKAVRAEYERQQEKT